MKGPVCWLLHVTARLPCPNAWGVVVLCFLASSCFMAAKAKAFGPVWGFVLPLYTMCCCCALYSCAEVFIFGSRTPIGHRQATHSPLSAACVAYSAPVPSAFPAPFLPPPCLVVCVCVRWVWCFFVPFVQFPLPHLGERSLEVSSLRGVFWCAYLGS